jgi:uncharacterized protein YndB with AHSA1/START domain
MPDIVHEFFVNASPGRVFEMFLMAEGMNRWCTKEASGEPKLNAEFRLYFGPGYDWRAKVTRYVPGSEFVRTSDDRDTRGLGKITGALPAYAGG